jgi:TRAP-type C4-dicarboxylate transport system permease small subunit
VLRRGRQPTGLVEAGADTVPKSKPRKNAPFGPLARGFDVAINTGAVLAASLLMGIMLATTVKVFFRYGLNEGLGGVDQISGTFMLYIAFFGAAWVLRREEHVTIDVLLGWFDEASRLRLLAVSSLIGALVCSTVAVYGVVEVVFSWQRGIRIPAEIEYLRAFNLAVIPLGSALLACQFLRRALKCLRGESIERESSVMEM